MQIAALKLSVQSAVCCLSRNQKSEGTIWQDNIYLQFHCTAEHMQQVAQKTEVALSEGFV